MTNHRALYHNRRHFLLLGAAAALLPRLGVTPARADTPNPMKIGVIGSGRLGGAVGSLFVKAGHSVMFSSRHPEELKALVDQLGARASAGTVAEAAAYGDVILLAVPYRALPEVGRDNAAALKGKVVLDACNPIAARDGDIVKEANANGVGETSAKYLPGARLVRAFNSFGAATFTREANRAGEKIGVPLASDDAGALKLAETLVREAGFEPVSVPLTRGREFAPPAPLFTKALPVGELKQQLGIAQ